MSDARLCEGRGLDEEAAVQSRLVVIAGVMNLDDFGLEEKTEVLP